MIWTNNTFTLTNKSTRSCCFALLLGPPPPNNIWSIHPLHTNSIVTIYPNNSLITENQQLRFNRHNRYYDVTTTSCTLENFAKFWVFNKIEFGKSQKPKISIYNFDSFQVKTKKKKVFTSGKLKIAYILPPRKEFSEEYNYFSIFNHTASIKINFKVVLVHVARS